MCYYTSYSLPRRKFEEISLSWSCTSVFHRPSSIYLPYIRQSTTFFGLHILHECLFCVPINFHHIKIIHACNLILKTFFIFARCIESLSDFAKSYSWMVRGKYQKCRLDVYKMWRFKKNLACKLLILKLKNYKLLFNDRTFLEYNRNF